MSLFPNYSYRKCVLSPVPSWTEIEFFSEKITIQWPWIASNQRTWTEIPSGFTIQHWFPKQCLRQFRNLNPESHLSVNTHIANNSHSLYLSNKSNKSQISKTPPHISCDHYQLLSVFAYEDCMFEIWSDNFEFEIVILWGLRIFKVQHSRASTEVWSGFCNRQCQGQMSNIRDSILSAPHLVRLAMSLKAEWIKAAPTLLSSLISRVTESLFLVAFKGDIQSCL